MFSATVIDGNRFNSWWIIAVRPRSVTWPVSGRSRPAMIFISVDLPAPFSPMSACTDPGLTCIDTSSSATTPGKPFRTPCTSTKGAMKLRYTNTAHVTSKTRIRLKVGVVGVGRLGRVYVRDLASRIPETSVVAVADINRALADQIAAEFDVPKAYGSAQELIADPNVDAVVVVTPTDTHRQIVVAAVQSKKPTFCEKPPAISLGECTAMADAINQSGTFFQMGFMRRFDPGYAAAKAKIAEGAIGRPVVFKSTSRDPFRPSLAY